MLAEASSRSELHLYIPLKLSENMSKESVCLKGQVVCWYGFPDEVKEMFTPEGDVHLRVPEPRQSTVKETFSLTYRVPEICCPQLPSGGTYSNCMHFGYDKFNVYEMKRSYMYKLTTYVHHTP